MEDVTIVIQAGGKSARMGKDKGLLEIGGITMVEFIHRQVGSLGERTFIVSNNLPAYSHMTIPIFPDIDPEIGALGGIFTALSYLETKYALILACDMPFVNLPLLAYQYQYIPIHHVVVPQINAEGYVEPFRAFYSIECLPFVEKAIQEGKRRVTSFYENVRVKYIQPEIIDNFDPKRISLTNVNTVEQWEKLNQMVGNSGKGN